MKKIIAGVLAAASMLSVSATAFATDKNVTKAGEVTYDVAVTSPKVVLNLVMPSKMAAALNPYGADIVIDNTDDTKTTVTNGIASAAYKVSNKSVDYGVYIDATATTTVTTSDKTKWAVKAEAPATDGTKSAQLALVADDTVAKLQTKAKGTIPTTSTAATATAQGALVMNSTAPADTSKGLTAGQTQQKKVFYLKAATDADTPVDMYMGLFGALAKDGTKDSKPVEVVWNEDDAINVALILKVSAGPKTLATS